MRKTVFFVLLLPFVLHPGPAAGREASVRTSAETPPAFVERLQGLLRAKNIIAYLGTFEPAVREDEQARLAVLFDDLGMTSVSLRTAGVKEEVDGSTRVFVQAFFENEFSAVIEAWTLALERRGEAWSVARLDVTGTMTRLYKIRIPSGREVRARRVEVRHQDVAFTFTDAAVFYDNLPDLETAMVVVGRGRVEFTPSSANERHQLELLYKNDRIEGEVESLFVRFSPAYFATNIAVEPDAAGTPITAAERAQAGAVFGRDYPRTFTIESSITGERLSFLPQGEEAVLEFKTRRFGELAYIYYPFSDDEISLYDRGKERVICLYGPQETTSPPLKRMFLSFGERFDVDSYDLELSYTPSSFYISARARIGVIPKVEALESLKFRLNADLEILKIQDAENRELFYTEDKTRELVYVYFLEPPAARTATSVEIYYRGRLTPAPPTTDVAGQTPTGRTIRPRPRFETFFYTHAGNWYPGPSEQDYFRARMTFMVPPDYMCVANGELVAQGRREDMDDVAALEKAGNSVYTYVSRSPVKYLSFIVGKFDQRRERPGPIPISSFVSSDIMDSGPVSVDQAADILDFYARAFGPFPYEKLGIVIRLWPDFGGNSPASFIVINDVPWPSESGFPVPVDTPVSLMDWDEYFLAHEIAHQWWGQGVSFDSYKDQWLSEGLAQFATASYLRRKYGEGAFGAVLRKMARWTEKKSFRGPIIMGSRLSYYDFLAYQSVIYDKAALALFMLRDLVGPEAFEAGLRSFFAAFKFRGARTAEFIAAMEAASGRDLKDFFQGWFYSWELPDVRTSWTETPVAAGVRVDVKVTQVKGRFVFPLWIEWTRGRESGRALLIVDGPTAETSLTLPGRPDRIRINPDKAVPGKFN